jgi:DNA-binding NtrC family response regulator
MARIIVIEDDPYLVDLVGQLLQLAEHEVSALSTPDHLLDTHIADLIVTDLFGDSASSQVALDQINRIRDLVGSVPIVICSGRAPLPASTVRELGVVDVISKPFDVDDFISRVETALQGQFRDRHGE